MRMLLALHLNADAFTGGHGVKIEREFINGSLKDELQRERFRIAR
jgi:hypothetical protein